MPSSIVNVIFLLCACCATALAQGRPETEAVGTAPMLFGHHDALLYGHSWSDSEEGWAGKGASGCQPDVYMVCGAYPALFSTDLSGLEQQGRTIYWGGVSYDRMREAILRHHRSGGSVAIAWHMRGPDDGMSYLYKEAHHGMVGRILQRQGKTYDTFMRFLSRGADFLLTLRDDEGRLIPIIFRPWHECNGGWFWWGTADCTAEEYVGLWRMTHDYMASRGLSNLRYVFSPGAWYRDEADFMQRFPGADYVDIIGTECYRPKDMDVEEARRSFRTHLQKNLRIASAIADSLHVPYALTETGMQPNTDPRWWTLGLMPALEGYSPLYIDCWSNQWSGGSTSGGTTWCTYPGEASARDFRKFYKMNKASFIKTIKKK